MSHIFPICISSLTDSVFSIRESTCKLLVTIYKDVKNDEFEKKLLEKLNELCVSTSYLLRNTALVYVKYFIEKLGDKIYFDFFEKKLVGIVLMLSKDKIANIRMNCVIILKKMSKVSKNRDILKEISSLLDELKRDRDIEVVNAISDY